MGMKFPWCSVVIALLIVGAAASTDSAVPAVSSGASPAVGDKIDVFNRLEDGYFCIKIPYIITTLNGTLIAFAEARSESCSDYARTTLVYKRSHDSGRTWSELSVLFSKPENASDPWPLVIGNAAPVQDASTGRIHVPFCLNNSKVMITASDDDGASWTTAVDITASVVRPDWHWVGLGPPAGLQLSTGRLLIPSYHGPFHWDDGSVTHVHVMYSDDHGDTWQIGHVFDNSTDRFLSNECQAAELSNGSVLINARGLGLVRCQAISNDGGLTFGPMVDVPEMPQPLDGCEGSTIMHPNGWLFFTNPHEASWIALRYNMTLQVSKDQGNSWQVVDTFDAKRPGSGSAAYSALTVLPDKAVGVLYERANTTQIIFLPDHITFEVVWKPDGRQY